MRLKPLLFEDAEQDAKFRQEARKVYNDLIEYLENGGDFRLQKSNLPFVVLDQFTDIGVNKSLKIEWGLEKSKEGDASYYKRGDYPVIEMKTASREMMTDPPEEKGEKMIKQLKNNSDVFKHEYIHYLDDLRSEKDLEKSLRYDKGSYDDEEYYSDPVEVNAFFQSALAEFEEFVEDSSHFKFMMGVRWSENFREFKDWIFEKIIPSNLLDSISSDQEKRLINRLYGFWKQLEDRYQNLKDDDV